MADPFARMHLKRRHVMLGAVAGFVALTLPARASPRPSLEQAVRDFTGGAPVTDGRVSLAIAPLVENGTAVGVTLDVESPMTARDHVRRIALFTEKNPQPDVAVFHLGPRAGRARVATRIRLATTQRVVAIAEMSDGTYWSRAGDVVVTLAACIEDLG